MWIPVSEAEIVDAIANGTLIESATFDAKAAAPAQGKNKDIARDICAMTVDGGLLLYGVGGADPTRPNERFPFDPAGIGERIDQVVQTAIAEAPTIEIRDIPSDSQPGRGYLAVIVPPSPRAPHMVTLGEENRYYGRGATGNRILSEGEVARLYARREQWEIDRETLLDSVAQDVPFEFPEPFNVIGPMVVVTRPVAETPRLLHQAADASSTVEEFLRSAVCQEAKATGPYPGQGTAGLEAVHSVTRRGADVFVISRDRDLTSQFQARAEVHVDGTLIYWHSPTINFGSRRGKGPLLMEQSVTRAVHQHLAVANMLYSRAGYVGPLDVAVSVLGLEEASGASTAHTMGPARTYGAPEYRRHERVTMTDLGNDPRGITKRLLGALFEVVSIRNYDPYAESRLSAVQ